MAKTQTMAKMCVFGRRFSIVYQTGKPNPFCVYTHDWEDRHGEYSSPSRKLLVRYANFESCLSYLLHLNVPEFRRES